MAKHAILSASGASRWLACPPSARVEQKFDDVTSEYAKEGTLAHDIAETTVRHELKEITLRSYNTKLNKLKSSELFAEDMIDYVRSYVDTCMEKVAEAKSISGDAVIKVEQRLDFREWVPEGFGTGDMVIIADGTIEVVDLKYGKGVPVSAIDNKQMRLYALGAISEFGFLYDIDKVKMTIVQPRLDSISTDEVSADELLQWAYEVLKPTAELAFKGEGEFCAGDHCGFCKARATCKARADRNLELAKMEFKDSNLLTDDEMSEVLLKADELAKWAKDVQEYALNQAVNHDKKWSGFKLVEGRSNRKYIDDKEVSNALIEAGYEDKIYKPIELLGITAMEKAIGKKNFEELLGGLIIKPQGKATLVVGSDKRPEINSNTQAMKDFKED